MEFSSRDERAFQKIAQIISSIPFELEKPSLSISTFMYLKNPFWTGNVYISQT